MLAVTSLFFVSPRIFYDIFDAMSKPARPAKGNMFLGATTFLLLVVLWTYEWFLLGGTCEALLNKFYIGAILVFTGKIV